jgi:hypothetical protein
MAAWQYGVWQYGVWPNDATVPGTGWAAPVLSCGMRPRQRTPPPPPPRQPSTAPAGPQPHAAVVQRPPNGASASCSPLRLRACETIPLQTARRIAWGRTDRVQARRGTPLQRSRLNGSWVSNWKSNQPRPKQRQTCCPAGPSTHVDLTSFANQSPPTCRTDLALAAFGRPNEIRGGVVFVYGRVQRRVWHAALRLLDWTSVETRYRLFVRVPPCHQSSRIYQCVCVIAKLRGLPAASPNRVTNGSTNVPSPIRHSSTLMCVRVCVRAHRAPSL